MNYPTGTNANEAQIGVTPNITSTQWATINLPDWTAPATPATSYDTITINPENDNAVDDGNTVSWVQLDNVCIREVPPIIESGDSVCKGQPMYFQGVFAGATSWSWDFGDGQPTSSQQNTTHPYANAGTYTVKLCVNGSTNCVTKSVTVYPTPPAPVITGPSNACGLSVATYSVPATAGVSYSWTVTNGTINGPSTGNSVQVAWNPTGGGTIIVTATNKGGCSSSSRMAVSNCDPQLPCCKEFQSKVNLKGFTHMGNGVYSFTSTLSVNQPNITRVTAHIISASVSYAPAGCAKGGPINAYVVSATPAVPGFTSTVPVQNGDEVIWYNNSGTSVSGLSFPFQIKFPPPAGNNCKEYLSFCVKYTFTDRNCKTCEVIRCFGPFLRDGPVKFDDETK